MSQIYKPLTSAGPIPPIIPTTFTTHDGAATPAANNLNVFTSQTGVTTAGTDNNIKGVTTSATGSTVNVILTNRITGTATTTDGVTPANVFTFNLGAIPGTYLFRSYLVVYDLTGSLGGGYSSFATVRTTGAVGTLLNTGNFFISEEGALSALDLANEVTANTLQLNVTGIAGKTIHYNALTEFIFVS